MKILGVVLCACLCLSLGGCVGVRALPDYRDTDFCATVRFESEGVTVYAEIEAVCAEVGGRATLRRVTLSEPSALSGAILEALEGRIAMRVEGVTAISAGAEAIWQTCRMVCAEGTLREVCDTELGDTRVRYSEIGEGDARVGVWRDIQTGLPIRFEQGARQVTVIRFVHT